MSGWSWLMSGWCHINVIVMMSGKTWLMSGATCALPVRIPVYSSLFKHEGLCDETQWLSRLGAESGIGTGTHIHTYTRTRVCMNIQSTPWCVCVLLGKRGALTRKHTHTCVLSTLPRTHTHTHTHHEHTRTGGIRSWAASQWAPHSEPWQGQQQHTRSDRRHR